MKPLPFKMVGIKYSVTLHHIPENRLKNSITIHHSVFNIRVPHNDPLQQQGISICKPFKAFMREEYTQWL
jgi:hypothetical protein